ncbi:MAG: hypothetical protein HKN45_02930 [Flavobacteriales bacterium]|nr:hypothetical protein [Flavobacteriales bacterium]
MRYGIDTLSDASQNIQSEEIKDDVDIESLIRPYRNEVELEMNEILCISEKSMIRSRPESALGNFVSDLCLQRAREISSVPIDCALFNYGGLRAALPEGDISRGKIFELMPFESELVVVEIPHTAMQNMFDYLAFTGGEPLSEINLKIQDGAVLEARVQGQKLEKRTYRVLTSDYLAGGGDKMVFLTDSERVSIEKLGLKIRDAILEHCIEIGANNERINKQLDGRIIME